MVPTGMVLVGSSVFSGLLAIGLFAVVHRVFHAKTFGDVSFFNDMSKQNLVNLIDTTSEIRVVKQRKKNAILHRSHRDSLSHIEVRHKNGNIMKIVPKNHHERESISNKISTLESKLFYYGLPNIIWTDLT